ncbi:FAD-dependent oxidoreductase [Deinococcus detaillensis]|uniref:FAD-dependent oxidoreductase n=1 Tax=Deinococcus detaillensis TaxID=2592048 RepID=A0A553V5R0_9DEIO|nr:FAD-dependent oxidoreductase [Deinococcus detaillensis]TSA87776.1 FAD-dependent oxidoreductase [Deinococcus detaillensis]
MTDFLVLGAGVAGLAAARDLAAAGMRVQVLDKSRGVSGRAATKRFKDSHGEGLRLDHGARFMTARHARTHALVSEGLEAGWLSEWTRSVPEWKEGRLIAAPDGHPRYVGAAGMSDIGKALAEGLDVKTGVQITQIERRDGQWQLHSADGQMFGAKTLLLNAPAPQLAALLGEQDQTGTLSAVTFQPCWAVGVALAADLEVNWPALRVSNHPALEWVAREHTKRLSLSGPNPPSLMLHARADWSVQHLEDSPQQVTALLLEAAREIVGDFEVLGSFAHRWRYATPDQRFAEACGWLPDQRLGWCGDWCRSDEHGPRMEAALLSGWALAERV